MFMLGIYLAPDGNIKYKVKNIHKKSTTRETSIREMGVQKNQVWKSLNSTTPKTIKCPLSIMTLKEK